MAERTFYPQPYVDHRILTLHGVRSSRLNDLPFFVDTFNRLIEEDLGVDVVGELRVHQFSPSEQGEGDGISGVAILGASHEAVHSWPELNHLRANFEFCSEDPRLSQLDRFVLARFNPLALESEQTIRQVDGSEFVRNAAYKRTLGRTESGLLIYEGGFTSNSGLPETARLLHNLEHPYAWKSQQKRKRVSHGPIILEVPEAA